MKIAIVRLSALGDIIQSAIVLQFIKKFRQDVQIDWFVDERFAGILENQPMINKIYAIPLKDKKIIKSLKIILQARKNKYDICIDLQGLIKSAIVSRLLCANNFGFDENSIKESFASNFYNQKLAMNYNENVFIRYIGLCAYVFNESFAREDIALKDPIFIADENIKERLKNELKIDQNKKNILIHVGSSEENKIYPKTKLAILCKMIVSKYKDSKILLCWGNKKEFEFANSIIKIANINEENIQIMPKFNLQELIAITKLANLIIGNDSGPTHLAFAMNKPSITLFGATIKNRSSFKTTYTRAIDSGKKIKDIKHFDKTDFCITKIDEDDIFKLVVELLGEH